MLFPYYSQEAVDGQKTQTRRPVQPGDVARTDESDANRIVQVARTRDHGVPQVLFEVGKSYSVQPGVAKKTVGKIRVTAIRRERLQEISQADVRQEVPVAALPVERSDAQGALKTFQETWNSMYKNPGQRWEDNPEVWVIEFESAFKQYLNK